MKNITSVAEVDALPIGSIVSEFSEGLSVNGDLFYYCKAADGWYELDTASAPMAGLLTDAVHMLEAAEGSLSVLWFPGGAALSPAGVVRSIAVMHALTSVLELFVRQARGLVAEYGLGVPVYVEGSDMMDAISSTLELYGLAMGDLTKDD